jgi:predicted helicase
MFRVKHFGTIGRIKATYIKESTAQKTKLYDMYARFFRWASDRIKDEGIIAFVSNRSFIDSRIFDGFRKFVARDFSEIWVVDLGGDWKRKDFASGGNVFGIGTGVAISFLVKRKEFGPSPRIFYAQRPEKEPADDKLSFLSTMRLSALDMIVVKPDAKQSWINQSDNDFETLSPIASKETKTAKTRGEERAIFKLFSLGVVTNRDDWVWDTDTKCLTEKVSLFISRYNQEVSRCAPLPRDQQLVATLDPSIKWTRLVKKDLRNRVRYKFEKNKVINALWRPFSVRNLYYDKHLNEMQYQLDSVFHGERVPSILMSSGARGAPCSVASDHLPSLDLFLPNACLLLSRTRIAADGTRLDNITGWALEQFKAHYEKPETQNPSQKPRLHPEEGPKDPSRRMAECARGAIALRDAALGGSSRRGLRTKVLQAGERPITKDAIFHYVYGVLHDPVYREKYAQNLKREFPRIPFYADFWRWAGWGDALMALHIGYESVEPWPLVRIDARDEKAATAGLAPKPILKVDKEHGIIVLDSETQLSGVPREAWDYRLGNRCAID